MLAYATVITAVHELGHALAARPAGYRLTSLGLGWGPRLVRLALPWGVIIVVHAVPFAGGSVVAIPERGEVGRRGAWFHAGGLLAQLGLGLAIAAAPERWWSQDLSDFNLVVLAWNLIPWRIQGQTSDGWWLASRLWPAMLERAWPGEGSGGSLALKGPAFASLAALERGRGSAVGLRYALLMQAWAALQRRALPEAAALLEELPALGGAASRGAPPILGVLEAYVAVERARLDGQPGPVVVGPALQAPLVQVALARAAIKRGALTAAVALLEPRPGVEPAAGLWQLAALELRLAEDDAQQAELAEALAAVLAGLGPTHADPIGAAQAAEAAQIRCETQGQNAAPAGLAAALDQPWLRSVRSAVG